MLLKQCEICCANCFNKLKLAFVITFRVNDLRHDEKLRDLDEQLFWFFCYQLNCVFVSVDVVIVSHERV